MARSIKRLVVCGGIGSGKSSVSRLLAGLGAVVVEADVLGHEVLQPAGEAFERVSLRWPEVVRGNRIDRGALAGIVFQDEAQLAELEAITHPFIRDRIAAAVTAAGNRDVVVEVPLLQAMVSGDEWVRVVVDASEETRLERLTAAGMSIAEARRRMAAQPTRAEWLQAADYVVGNDGTLQDLEQAVTDLWNDLSGSATSAPSGPAGET